MDSPKRRSPTLRGVDRDRAHSALLLVDTISDFAFDGGEKLVNPAAEAAKGIAACKRAAHARGIPTIYANDNFGRWQWDFRKLVDYCLGLENRGREIVKWLQPEPEDYFVLKPKHSAFFSTSLDALLHKLGTKRLILVGFTAHQCLLFTANDAFMRDYELCIPRDCTASPFDEESEYAFRHFSRALKADVRPCAELDAVW